MLTADLLRDALHYEPETGAFTWLAPLSNRVKPGDQPGFLTPAGYLTIRLMGRLYSAHRLAWLYHYGEWPKHQVDHINGDKSDNRIANLRDATAAQNKWNCAAHSDNRSGFKGVTFHKASGLWRAQISVNGKNKGLGYFHKPEDASKVYQDFAKGIHGEFFNG
jgi:hypothetical protein